jgi:cobalt-zinc-cadmium efflux system protein
MHTQMDSENRLKIATIISVVVLLMEIFGGVISNSLALLSDAGHVFADLLSLSLALFAIRLAKYAHTSSMTYGFHRAEILAALANGATLIGISVYIFYEAFLRFLHPPPVEAPVLLFVATLGLIANAGTAKLLWPSRTSNLNLRAAFLHVIGDLLGSAGVVLGAVFLLFTGVRVIDPIIAALIGALILKSAIDVSRESANVLLEGVPREIDMAKVTEEILKVEGVQSVHELHVWSITSGFYVLTGHVTIRDQMLSQAKSILDEITAVLRTKFSIAHVTLQPETAHKVIAIDQEKAG